LARKLRKQRVSLRFKRREHLKHRVRTALVRSVAIALVAGFGAGLVANHNSILLQFLQRHTPQVSVKVPEALVGLPVMPYVPRNHLWLWIPGSAWWLEQKLTHTFSAVHHVFFERQFQDNRVVIHVMPRVPLVTWSGKGFDRDGMLFAITPGTWKVLPQASFLSNASKPELGHWLARLESMTPLWSQVASIKQDAYGSLELALKTGSVVIWGPPDVGSLARKAQTLLRVLDDAHHHLGGTALADLRFFDQGRIIVKPKARLGN
jgi:hypothetical protein